MAIPEISNKISVACALNRLKPRPPVAGTMPSRQRLSSMATVRGPSDRLVVALINDDQQVLAMSRYTTARRCF